MLVVLQGDCREFDGDGLDVLAVVVLDGHRDVGAFRARQGGLGGGALDLNHGACVPHALEHVVEAFVIREGEDDDEGLLFSLTLAWDAVDGGPGRRVAGEHVVERRVDVLLQLPGLAFAEVHGQVVVSGVEHDDLHHAAVGRVGQQPLLYAGCEA